MPPRVEFVPDEENATETAVIFEPPDPKQSRFLVLAVDGPVLRDSRYHVIDVNHEAGLVSITGKVPLILVESLIGILERKEEEAIAESAEPKEGEPSQVKPSAEFL